MRAIKDISGQRFGRLVAIKIVGRWKSETNKNTSIIWECRCDCGKIVKVKRMNLGYGTSSCGCLRKERARKLGKASTNSLPKGTAARNKFFGQYKANAKRRNLDFLLTINQFSELTKQNCFYCGSPPNKKTGSRAMNGKYLCNGIDRCDNKIGYTMENCVPCCEICNRAKLQMSIEEFDVWIKKVFHHRNPELRILKIN